MQKLDEALANVTKLALNPEALTNLALAISNLRGFSDRALVVADNLNGILTSNGPALGQSVSNLVAFSHQLNDFGDGLNGILATNRQSVQVAVSNIERSTETLKLLLSDVHAGKGLAGEVLRNDKLATNVVEVVQNLSITTSNLNRLGLWKMLWQHKPPKNEHPEPHQLKSPKGFSE